MTATFGKLENQTLTLKPGLNVIQAPNEWGKTTWCAFLVNMLYGMETRVKSTKSTLADKERYAPWSGSPMSGQIDLQWQGKDITIERWTKGRTPLGMFRACETDTGMEVKELTAENCGEMLLGVERSVFLRSGFLRLTDMAVTEDESLRRRLNALVTTGDESDAGDQLAQKLRDLKNKCRANRTTGAIPTVEKQISELEEKLYTIRQLRQDGEQMQQRQESLREQIQALDNHSRALEYASAEENRRRLVQAQMRWDEAKKRVEALQRQCRDMPERQSCVDNAVQLQRINGELLSLNLRHSKLPPPPEKPAMTLPFTPEEALLDGKRLSELAVQNRSMTNQLPWMIAVGLLGAVGTVAGLLNQNWVVAVPMVAALAAGIGLGFRTWNRRKTTGCEIETLTDKYGSSDPACWEKTARENATSLEKYNRLRQAYQKELADIQQTRQQYSENIQVLTGGQPVDICLENWTRVMNQWDELSRATETCKNAEEQVLALTQMAKSVPVPEQPDYLTDSTEMTVLKIKNAKDELQKLGQQYGNLLGRIEAMGQEQQLQQQLEAARQRMEKLTEFYDALDLAQSTLIAATAELQRRFAPKIAKEAQMIFGKLTDGRYNRLTIAQDLSLQAGAGEESVMHTAQWRSEGTIDQMYLALRLAVSKAVMPDCPLILDDALLRFDDVRHATAMEILKEEASQRQIILFTCQSRELKS